jgi:hypothetical protein
MDVFSLEMGLKLKFLFGTIHLQFGRRWESNFIEICYQTVVINCRRWVEGGVKGCVKEDVLSGWSLARDYIMVTLSQEESRDKSQV